MLSILVVDDEAPIRDWIVYCIERAGEHFHVVRTAKSGKEAYDMVLEYKPNVVITDIKMPGIDGIELMQMVKPVLPYTTFIILTNYAEFSYAKKAITYGAIEYLLKSELRSVDLINLLEKFLMEQTKLLDGKNAEILSNGYVDLYSLYQNYEDKTYCSSFWKSLGMNADKPYCIIGVFENVTSNQRQELAEIAKEVSPYYFNAAFRQRIVYIIIQEETRQILEQSANRFVNRYFENSMLDVAVGHIQEDLSNFINAIEQVQSTLSSAFFKSQKGIFYYNHLLQEKKLDRNGIRHCYNEILSLVPLRQYNKAIEAINAWFDSFLRINVQDIVWAKEMCIKLVISIEERLCQLNLVYEYSSPEMGQLNSSQKCKDACIDMIETMYREKDGVRSKSISEALDYIHRNYNKDISLTKISNNVYRSPEYFSRLFKEEVGVNFSVYLMMYRLSCAEQLLKTSNLQISQIACEVGYANPGYFSRIYKKYMGMTPEEAKGQNSVKRSK
ncbi:MAG: response regulator transcription factor [Clostridia bacterium]